MERLATNDHIPLHFSNNAMLIVTTIDELWEQVTRCSKCGVLVAHADLVSGEAFDMRNEMPEGIEEPDCGCKE